jgi:hypothetical protein
MLSRSVYIGSGCYVAISRDKQLAAMLWRAPEPEKKSWRQWGRRSDSKLEVVVFDTRNWRRITTIRLTQSSDASMGYGQQVGLSFSPDGRHLLVFDHAKYQLLDPRNGRVIKTVRTGPRLAPLQFSNCGRFLVTGDGGPQLLEALSGALVKGFALEENEVIGDVACSEKGDVQAFLASSFFGDDAAEDETLSDAVIVQRWPWDLFVPIRLPLVIEHSIFGLDLAYDASRLAVITSSAIKVFSTKSLKPMGSIRCEVQASWVCYGRDLHLLYTEGDRVSVVDSHYVVVDRFVTYDDDRLPPDGVAPPWAALTKY